MGTRPSDRPTDTPKLRKMNLNDLLWKQYLLLMFYGVMIVSVVSTITFAVVIVRDRLK
ncbi:MAG: hypothetical protein V7L23_29975 [Nostoc sp.]|uniref:hypothetical protein n=1 Tax=Nostoc sp. TaxID=1180 RepID=UPI002FEF658C